MPPSEAALLALARGGPAAWPVVCRDPGTVLLLLRLSPDLLSPIDSPAVLETALHHLRTESTCPLDWADARRAPVLAACLAYAREARLLATLVGTVDPERAWTAAL